MGLKHKKGFVHTLEAVIAASLLITTASVVIPQLQPDNSIEDTTQANIFQGLQTIDKTGELRSDLSTNALKEEVELLNPNEFNTTVLVADTDTESFRLNVDGAAEPATNLVGVVEQRDWQGIFDQTSVDRMDNSGDLGIGYRNGTPSDNLKGYWRMDRVSGDAIDYSGNNRDGTYGGSPERGVPGVFSTNSTNFETDYIDAGPTEITGEITVMFWVKFDQLDGLSEHQLIVAGDYDGSNSAYEFKAPGEKAGNSPDDYFRFQSFDGDPHGAEVNKSEFETGKWYHLTGIYNGETWAIYKNGENVTDGTYNTGTGAVSSSENLYIGAQDTSQGFLNGKLDEVRIYNTSLSENQIKKSYFSGRKGFFNGSYSRSHSLADGGTPKKIGIDSEGINSGNTSWVKVETGEGESNEIKLDTGTTDKNYSLGVSQDTSEIDIDFNFSVDNATPISTPLINSYRIWTGDGTDQKIVFDKKGDSVKSQIFIDEADGLNISYNSNLIAENITESKYLFEQTQNDGTLSFSGKANVTVDITNKTIRGNPAIQEDVKNVNYPIYQNGSKEVTVSTWN